MRALQLIGCLSGILTIIVFGHFSGQEANHSVHAMAIGASIPFLLGPPLLIYLITGLLSTLILLISKKFRTAKLTSKLWWSVFVINVTLLIFFVLFVTLITVLTP